MSPSNPREASRHVWDSFVRVFHWTLVSCVLLNRFVMDGDTDLHHWLGYLAVGLVAARVVWGFIGSRHARFADFFPTPRRIVEHLRGLLARRPAVHWGHNPLGALMVLTLMGLVLAIGVTGWMQGLDAYFGEEWLQDLHGLLADGLMVLVGLHVTAVVVMGRLERTRLVKAMFSGVKERY